MTVSASQGKALWEQEHPAPGIGAPAAAPPPPPGNFPLSKVSSFSSTLEPCGCMMPGCTWGLSRSLRSCPGGEGGSRGPREVGKQKTGLRAMHRVEPGPGGPWAASQPLHPPRWSRIWTKSEKACSTIQLDGV